MSGESTSGDSLKAFKMLEREIKQKHKLSRSRRQSDSESVKLYQITCSIVFEEFYFVSSRVIVAKFLMM